MSPVKESTDFTRPTIMKSIIFVVFVASLVGRGESRPSPEAPPANYMGTFYDSVPPYTPSIFTYHHTKDTYASPPPTSHYENLYTPPQHHSSSRPQDRHSSDYSRPPPKKGTKGYSYTAVDDIPGGSYSPYSGGYQPESWYNTMKGGYDDYGYTGYSVPKRVPGSPSVTSSGPPHHQHHSSSSGEDEDERRHHHPSGSTPDEDEPSAPYEANNDGGSSSSGSGDDDLYSTLGQYEEDDIGGPPVYSAYGKGSRRPQHAPKSRPYSSHHKDSYSYRVRPTYGPPKKYQHKVKTYTSYGPPPSVSYGSSRRPSYGPPHHLVIKGKKKRNSLPKRRPRPSHHQREKVVDDDIEESLNDDDFKWKNERRQNKDRRNTNKSRNEKKSKRDKGKDRTKDNESNDEEQSSGETSPLPRLSAIWNKIVGAISEEV